MRFGAVRRKTISCCRRARISTWSRERDWKQQEQRTQHSLERLDHWRERYTIRAPAPNILRVEFLAGTTEKAVNRPGSL
jgi:hypothetical protein